MKTNKTSRERRSRRSLHAGVIWRRKPCPECGGRMQLQTNGARKYWSCTELVESEDNPNGPLSFCPHEAEYGKPDNDGAKP